MIPGLGGKMKELKGAAPDEAELKKVVAIIDSMTAQERRNAKVLNGSRRKRIAAGSGTTVQDVNRLMKNFQQAEEMIKRMSKGGKPGWGETSFFQIISATAATWRCVYEIERARVWYCSEIHTTGRRNGSWR